MGGLQGGLRIRAGDYTPSLIDLEQLAPKLWLATPTDDCGEGSLTAIDRVLGIKDASTAISLFTQSQEMRRLRINAFIFWPRLSIDRRRFSRLSGLYVILLWNNRRISAHINVVGYECHYRIRSQRFYRSNDLRRIIFWFIGRKINIRE